MTSIVRSGMKKNIPEKQDGIRKGEQIRTQNVDLGNSDYSQDKVLLIPGACWEFNKYLWNE